MDELLAYLNGLDKDARQQFADSCGTTIGYLRKACSIKQVLGPELCAAVERASGGAITRAKLRPDDYLMIWPELGVAA